jgi:hypothetical protein
LKSIRRKNLPRVGHCWCTERTDEGCLKFNKVILEFWSLKFYFLKLVQSDFKQGGHFFFTKNGHFIIEKRKQEQGKNNNLCREQRASETITPKDRGVGK